MAVVAEDATLTLGELLERADAVAARLGELGVRPGQAVAVRLPRSAALVTAWLGVLRAGAGYVAIDATQPAERARALIDQSGALALIDPDGSDVTGVGRVVALTGRADPVDDLAYVMFTSGSTGRPKGALVTRAGVANLARWHGRAFDVRPGTRCSQLAGAGFDAAAWETWGCLANGGTLVVAPEAVKTDPIALRDWLVAQRVGVAFVPTPLAEALLALDWPADTALRSLLTGGDRLHRRPRAGLPFTLVNNYGVTEATVVSTSAPVAPGDGAAPGIGAPVDGVTLRVVDPALREVADGERGELLVGGVSVALGYVGAPELTAAAFVTAPDGTGPWYRTGDLVQRGADGHLTYLARVDDQIQVRGNRVEPGEVEAVLGRHPAVAACAVLGTDARLAAFWQGAADEAALRAHLGVTLPPYMLPEVFAPVASLPVTANGKVDRAALAALVPAPAQPAESESDDADVDTAVARIVADVLKLPSVEAEDNFLLLGGHSLLGAQVMARLADRFDVEISLRDLFDNPTPRGMAQLVVDELTAQVLALDDATAAELAERSAARS